jgi:hypothetical protein
VFNPVRSNGRAKYIEPSGFFVLFPIPHCSNTPTLLENIKETAEEL